MPRKQAAKFKCGQCGKTFKMAMHLGRHMTTIHGQPKPPATPMVKPTRKASRVANGDLAGTLVATIDELQAQRREHVDAIAEIDAVFAKYGIQLPDRARPGRKPGRRKVAGKPGGRRKRGSFKQTGVQSILDFVKGKGKSGATSAEINQQWKSEGRGATADTTLSQLTNQKQLKRVKIKGAKGSRYTTA